MISYVKWWNRTWQDFTRVLFFFLIFFLVERIIFLLFHPSFWNFAKDPIFYSLWLGFRFSFATAFFPALGIVLFCRIPQLFFPSEKWEQLIKSTLIYIALFILSILFIGRFPFYQNYHNSYNSFIFQGENESLASLIVSVGSWQTWGLLISGVVIFWGCSILLWRLFEKIPYLQFPGKTSSFYRWIFFLFSLVIIVFLCFLCRYSGSFRSADKLRWENIARTPNHFLNELILDDFQALLRAKAQRAMTTSHTTRSITSEQMKEYGLTINKEAKPGSNNWDNYTKRVAKGEKIEKPTHIFIILSESYGQWPLLPAYNNWHLADGMKSIISQPNSVWFKSFISNGAFTHYAVAGITTGLAGMDQPLMYMPQNYKGTFATAISPQMKKLGYQTNFWYGGPGSWQQINQYTLAQGFDHFYGVGEMELPMDNAWGVTDNKLFSKVADSISSDRPTVNVILTTSNHPPFSIDLKAEGIDLEELRSRIPSGSSLDKNTLNRIGHYWYADREMERFIKKMQEKYPDSLFIVTGDHSTRIEIEGNFTPYERISVPLIITGKGINEKLFPKENAGSQMQIIPTLIELIAPIGFEYYSLAPSLTEFSPEATSTEWWMTATEIGSRQNQEQQNYQNFNYGISRDPKWEEAILAFSWWRLNKGNVF